MMSLDALFPFGLATFLVVFFRIIGALMVAPGFGMRMVPVRARLALSFAITLVIAPTLPALPAGASWMQVGWLVAEQTVIGIAMGFAVQMVFDALIMAGQTIAMSMGLGFATLVDSQHGVQVPVLSQFFVVLGTLVFLSLDGHLAVLQLVADSFRLLPVGQALSTDGLWGLVAWGTAMFAGALRIALPAVVAILVVHIAFGVMSRAAPTLNLFAVGFPATLLLGFVILLGSIDGFSAAFRDLFAASLDNVTRLLAL